MGGVQVNAVDENNFPLAGVTFTLILGLLEPTPVDTQVTGASGSVTLDAHTYVCFPTTPFTVNGYYQTQQQSQNELANVQCFAPLMVFHFNRGGQACAGGAQCPPPLQCVNGVCAPKTPPSGCSNSAQCSTGFICVNGVCVPKTPQTNYSIAGILAVVAAGVGVWLWKTKGR